MSPLNCLSGNASNQKCRPEHRKDKFIHLLAFSQRHATVSVCYGIRSKILPSPTKVEIQRIFE
jgi:hypothetical protein